MELFRWAFDPWGGMRQLRSEMEDAFGRLNRAVGLKRPALPVAVFQGDSGVTLYAEVPGVKAEDMTIEAEGDSLKLPVKRAVPEGVALERYHRRERPAGEFTRELKLPAGLDADKIEAKLSDGILAVHLPKADAAKPRKIAVKAE